jgi:hypothetical protein
MSREMDVFLRLLLESMDKPVNLSTLCECLATDNVGQLAFGQALKSQTEMANGIFPGPMVSMNGAVSLFSR